MRYVFVNSLENLDPRMLVGRILVTPDGSAYKAVFGDELGGIGSIFSKIAGIAAPFANFIPVVGPLVSTGLSVASGLTASSGNGQQAKGLAAIQSKGAEVIKAFDALKQKITSEANFTKSDAYTTADKLVAILSDSTEFYQAKSGKDADALAGFKTQAAQLAAQAKTLADATDAAKQQQTVSATGASGQIVKTVDAAGNVVYAAQPASNLPFGLSTSELIIGGIAIYFFFLRGK